VKTALIGSGLLAAAGIGTYLYNKPKLRQKLMNAHDVHEAMDIIKEHMSSDVDNVKEAGRRKAVRGLRHARRTLHQRFGQADRRAHRAQKKLEKRLEHVEHAAASAT
jgi:hypothetical protein